MKIEVFSALIGQMSFSFTATPRNQITITLNSFIAHVTIYIHQTLTMLYQAIVLETLKSRENIWAHLI